jgi:4'-phosphopantetheinyl transferase
MGRLNHQPRDLAGLARCVADGPVTCRSSAAIRGAAPQDLIDQLRSGATHVWAGSITAGLALADCLAEEDRSTIARVRLPKERRRRLAARAILRDVLAHYTSTTPAALRFAVGRFGTPKLGPPHDHIEFSVARGGEWSLVAVTDGRRASVGVDIEPLLDFADRPQAADAVFGGLAAAPGWDACRSFFEAWTTEEAVLKALGIGFLKPGAALPIPPADRFEADRIIDLAEVGRVRLVLLTPAPDHLGALALVPPSSRGASNGWRR